jgi:hypothetical protein
MLFNLKLFTTVNLAEKRRKMKALLCQEVASE